MTFPRAYILRWRGVLRKAAPRQRKKMVRVLQGMLEAQRGFFERSERKEDLLLHGQRARQLEELLSYAKELC